jgi:tRNA modification GTPase
MIRLSGAATREVLASVLSGVPRPFDRACFASRLRPGSPLGLPLRLPVLVCTYRAPASYTGEDSAEILMPGNPDLIARVLELLTAHEGVRPAGPGEFSARAYLNDKLTLEQADGVAAVIAAQTREQLAAAAALMAGRTPYRAWAEELATLLALVEAGIDFTDQEDVVPIAPAALAARLRRLAAAMEDLLGGAGAREASGSLPRAVLAGAPNAGKSTLFNALLGRDRAVVSPVAGTTRDALEEELDLSVELPGGGSVLLVDLAGLESAVAGAAAVMAQAAACEAIAGAQVVVHCDPTGRFEPLGTVKPVIRVRTKADLPGSPDGGGAISVCALDGWNLAVLRRAIADAACVDGGASAVLPRHRRAVETTRAALRSALGAFGAEDRRLADPELVAGALRLGLDALGELVGRVSPDDVIGRIFATFCVGK